MTTANDKAYVCMYDLAAVADGGAARQAHADDADGSMTTADGAADADAP